MNDIEKSEILRQLRALMHRYSFTEEGKWLFDIEWIKIPADLKELKGDVMGKYSFGKIILRESYDPKLIFATYVHELRHRWQWEKTPWLYLIGKIIRPIIEKDAYAQEALADAWLEKEPS